MRRDLAGGALLLHAPGESLPACASIVFLRVAMDSPEVEARRFTVFLGDFLFMLQNKTRLEIPVRVDMTHTEGATGNDHSANFVPAIRLCLIESERRRQAAVGVDGLAAWRLCNILQT